MSHYLDDENAVAIVGMSCRFAPDLDTPAALWDFLLQSRSTVRPMPEKRWRAYADASPEATAVLRGTTLLGSYLDDIDGFDAEFFGITPKEAAYLDPQQRFMLELSWEALVDAGIPPTSLRGSDAAVYAAVNSTDYGRRLLEDMSRTGPYAVNGTTDYGIANRVSYFLDTRGPSMAVNTACAASLTAVHVACQALRGGETTVAIVGGLNIISTPALNVALEGAGALAPDGRSKAYDDAADGYGRGEGAGVLVLKRLADAERDGDRVHAVLRGSGVFQDGHSDGMMAPNADAQAHMLRTVYARAGIDPATVGYVEAHGTGTPTGDAAELDALARVVGAGRDVPCVVGSVKPNIGHVEGGSGMAGILKVVLALRHGTIPPSLHSRATTRTDWGRNGLRLAAEAVDWAPGATPRRAGVSNYGVGGTIAHLVLEEAPVRAAADLVPATGARPVLVPLSSTTRTGVRALAGATARWLARHEPDLDDVVRTLRAGRSHLSERTAVVARDVDALADGLARAEDGETSGDVVAGRVVPGAERGAVWVFSGHGAQWEGMGQELLDVDTAFTGVIDDLAAVFTEELGQSPREMLAGGGPWTTAEVQALTFAVQAGLAATWRAHGHEPAAVVGHSVGEIAAATTAGVLDLHEAGQFACRRARALGTVAGDGAMAMVGLDLATAGERLRDVPGVVAAIAAAPRSTVVSGDADAVAAVVRDWGAEGLPVRPVATDLGFHSPQVDPVLDEVVAAAGHLRPRPAAVLLYSTTLEDPRDGSLRDAGYWGRNLRDTVRFAGAVDAALEDGYRVFLEVSSHPVVAHSVLEVAAERGEEVAVVATLRRGAGAPRDVLHALGELFCAGPVPAWTDRPREPLGLPGVVWQHRPYWLFEDSAPSRSGAGHDPEAHDLLGGHHAVGGVPARQVWQTRLDRETRPYPLDHALDGVEVTPAASVLNSFLKAAGGAPDDVVLRNVVLRTPLAVEPARTVQVVREGQGISLSSRVADDDTGSGDHWILHSTAVLEPAREPLQGRVDPEELRAHLPLGDWDRLDAMFHNMGVGGYAFPWSLDELHRSSDEQLAVLTLVADADAATSWAHVVDGALTISATLVTPVDARTLWMSRAIESVAVSGEPPARIVVHTRRSPGSPDDSVDVDVARSDGRVVARVRGLAFSSVERLEAANPQELVHEVVWRAPDEPVAAPAPLPACVAVVGDGPRATKVAAALGRAGVAATVTGGPVAAELVLVVAAPTTVTDPEDAVALTQRTAETLLGTIDLAPTGASSKVWFLTEGVRSPHGVDQVAQAAAWGLGRIVAGEHPEVWGGVVDVPSVDHLDGATLARVLEGAAGREDVVHVAPDGTVQVPRLTRITRAEDGEPLRCSPSGSVLVTGGLGALGLEAAQWLVSRGARRLVLVGRRGLPPRQTWGQLADPALRRAAEAVAALEAAGVSVQVRSLDLTDADAVRRFVAEHDAANPAITGIVHAAGGVDDALIDNMSLAGVRQVFGAKSLGAWTLHEIFPPGSLDFFIGFSSCGQLAHLSGQGAYAAANSFLDALVQVRAEAGERGAVSLAWTSWRGLGLSAELTTTMVEGNMRGLDAVSASEALQAWSFADRFAGSYQAVLRALPVSPGLAVPPMFRDLEHEAAPPEESDVYRPDPALAPAEARTAVTDVVHDVVAAELRLAKDDLGHRRPLVELGVDSIMAIALRARLQRRFALDFPPTILWAKPTVHDLGGYVHEVLQGARVAAEEGDGPHELAAQH
ncbi:type I polyketide synthase [Isoptericola sp. 178]|uniref:type I polyketide synthase n=1 Tax=Isoptericola sp. 178 TaxID=3064651 RepID=UPI002713ECA2|nr:type I polyketide synthase [Isoptericola sp. 178]MDO8145895.1 beta-ketoacyl synthase N-terminal-like domain-containing protein [Isoptericola sp. 178]